MGRKWYEAAVDSATHSCAPPGSSAAERVTQCHPRGWLTKAQDRLACVRRLLKRLVRHPAPAWQ